jgi:TatD DNase family protein
MFDSHCHLDCDAFDGDRAAVLIRAQAAGVTEILIPAVDERSWQPILELARTAGNPRCHAALGIHPVALPAMAPDDDDAVLQRLEQIVGAEKPSAIGECGLDTTINLEAADLARQERVLAGHFRIAVAAGLPLVLHARGPGSYERLLTFLRAMPGGWRGVLHSYGGGAELLKKYLELPLHFGFAGPATYPNARRVRASIAAVPIERLLGETDAPDQTPEPHRPGRSEPAYCVEIVRALASIKGKTEAEMEEWTSRNARKLFAPAAS